MNREIKQEIENLTILIATAREEGDKDEHKKVVNRILEIIKKERQLELLILKKHIEQQIYQQTINTDSLYEYIESAYNHLI